MWPLPTQSQELVTISLTPQSCAIACFSHRKKSSSPPLHLTAHEVVPLPNLEYLDGLLFNPNVIHNALSTFIRNHTLRHPAVALSIAGPDVQEIILKTATASPNEKQFSNYLSGTILWDYLYLYPEEHNFYFYVLGITKKQLAQYTAFACGYGYQLVKITTANAALIELYKRLHHGRFRHSKLAQDLQDAQHNIENLVTSDDVRFLVTHNNHISHTDLAVLMPAIGMAHTFFKEQ